MDIRHGEPGDLEELNELYNHYVRETPITFDLDEITMDARKEWFASFGGRYILLVAVNDGSVVGYAHSKQFRPKQAYETSVETTVYLHHEHHGKGTGTALYERLFAELSGLDIHRVYAGITVPNPASFALHRRFGFEQVAYFTEQGRKFGRYWDVAWFEKPL
jgi:phosphinothricin acetyltransferase